jgi:hypothetical protein
MNDERPMTDDRSRRSNRVVSTFLAFATAGSRLVADVLIVGLWVMFLTLLFLTTDWPRWLFYVLLLVGVGLYVQFTASWLRPSTPVKERN